MSDLIHMLKEKQLVFVTQIRAKLLILNGALGGTRTPDTLVRSLILNNRKHYKSTSYDASNHRLTA
jgi:hypothetical protein